VRFKNPIGKRLDFVRKQYASRPEVFAITRTMVAHALRVAPKDIDLESSEKWEKAIPWLGKQVNSLLKKRDKGADISRELSRLDKSFLTTVRAFVDRPKRKGKRQAQLATMSPKQARKFAARTVKDKLEKKQEQAAKAGYKMVKRLGDGYVAVVGMPNVKAPPFPRGLEEQKRWVEENAKFQQWLGTKMNNCLGFFGAYENTFPLGKFDVQRKGGKLYAIVDPNGKPVAATLTNAKGKVIETNGPGNRPPPESAQPYIEKLEKAMKWVSGKLTAFHPPQGFDERITGAIEGLIDSGYFTDNLRERRYFIRKVTGYSRQAGADFSEVWPKFAMHILVGSKYSALNSVKKIAGKAEIQRVIIRVAKLYKSDGSTKEFRRAAYAAIDAAGTEEAAELATTRAGYAAYVGAEAASAASASGLDTFKAASAARSAVNASPTKHAAAEDCAKKLLELMREAASNAGRNLQRRQNPKKTKKAARKATPQYQILINRCQKLWDAYCEKATKKNLRAVLGHLDKMKNSTSKKVADERRRCLRVANKEARRLKL
jgi:hypothetical protein